MRYISITLSIIAVSCSIATLIVVWNGSNEYLGFDSSAFYGCLITVLSILVVVLMGWQIINYLSFEDRIRKEIEKSILSTDKKVDYKLYILDKEIGAILLHSKANYITSEKCPKNAVADYIKAIECYHEAQKDTKGVINDLSTHLFKVEKKDIQFTKEQIDSFDKILSDCNVDKTLVNRIRKLEIKSNNTSEAE